jgi:hypothetical protein
MSRDFLRGPRRPDPGPAGAFDGLLDRLAKEEPRPAGHALPRWRLAPDLAWPGAVDTVEPPQPEVAVHSAYADGAPVPTPAAAPRSLEEAVALELQLQDIREPADLERARRRFAFRNHPDRAGPLYRDEALRRMAVANALVDEALKAARARNGGTR